MIKFICLSILSLITMAATAGVINVAWPWFLTPLLGVAAPSFGLLMGGIYITRLLTHPVRPNDLLSDLDEDDRLKLLLASVVIEWVRLAVILGLLWIVHISM